MAERRNFNQGKKNPGVVDENGVGTSYTGDPICGAIKRNSTSKRQDTPYCMKPAGWGTSHKGYGMCKLHQGNSPAHILHAAKLEMEDITKDLVMGAAIDVSPMDALLWCVRITAGEVAYATWRVELLSEDEAVLQPETTLNRIGGKITQEITRTPHELNIWIKVRQDCVARLARYSKMALDAGVAERQVQLAEEAGERLALMIRSILNQLKLTPEQEQKAPEIVRGALAQLEQRTETIDL